MSESIKDQIDGYKEDYLEKEKKPIEFYNMVRDSLRKACSKYGESDALGGDYQEGVNGYTHAAEILYTSGHPAAADALLIESWNDRGKRQLKEKGRIYRAGIAWKLADLFLKRRDYGAALWWALHTQADDILGNNEDRGAAGRWQLRTVLGMSEATLEELNGIADKNRAYVETKHDDDWSHVRGFAEDAVLRFVLDTKSSSLFAQESSVREFPLSTAYFDALLRRVKKAITEKKGKELEYLASYLFLLIPGWVPRRNVRHSRWAFETDLVVSNLRPEADLTADLLGRHFPVECKNWVKRVGVQHVGYFLYRMRLTHSKFGVLFVASQITGHKRGWAADELIRMAFHEDGSVCVILTQADLNNLLKGKTTFRSMLLEKLEHVRFGKPSRSQSELQSINGIGPKRAERLEQMGITTLAKLVSANSTEVADAMPRVADRTVKEWQAKASSHSG